MCHTYHTSGYPTHRKVGEGRQRWRRKGKRGGRGEDEKKEEEKAEKGL